MDHCMLRLRSYEGTDHGDARFLMQFLKMVLPELFDEAYMEQLRKAIES
jgi:hypothetical protein